MMATVSDKIARKALKTGLCRLATIPPMTGRFAFRHAGDEGAAR
jgi:hypothetical protein